MVYFLRSNAGRVNVVSQQVPFTRRPLVAFTRPVGKQVAEPIGRQAEREGQRQHRGPAPAPKHSTSTKA
eukprot:6918519-Lingulodinium_polyedra.AAC.1